MASTLAQKAAAALAAEAASWLARRVLRDLPICVTWRA
jgi:hypothetical protein